MQLKYSVERKERVNKEKKLVLLFIFIWGAGDGELALFV